MAHIVLHTSAVWMCRHVVLVRLDTSDEKSISMFLTGKESDVVVHNWSNTDDVQTWRDQWRHQRHTVASTGETHTHSHTHTHTHDSLCVGGRLLTSLVSSCFFQNGTLHFCGFQVLPPQVFWSPAHCPPPVRTAMLDGWRARLKGLLAEKPLTFAPCELFDLTFQGGFMMFPKVKEEREWQPFGLTTGHHLGKPLPPDNQIRAQGAEPDCRK